MKETIVAPATPLIKSSIAIVRVSGPLTKDIIKKHITTKNVKPRYAYHAFFKDSEGKELDEIVFIYYKEPKSYTGEDMLEIFFHGNPTIVKLSIEELIKDGCVLAKRGEFTRRALLNGRIDLVKAKSIESLIEAKTKFGIERVIYNLKGGFSKIINELKEKLIYLIANLEADIEFSDEGIENITIPEIKSILDDINNTIEKLSDKIRDQRFITEGIKLSILGYPNVGKSSLFNALIEKDRAIVSDIEGTTRDYIEDSFEIYGIPVKIIDTAGFRKTEDKVEIFGIEKALEKALESDLILFVLDASRDIKEEEIELFEKIKHKNILIVLNKIDIAKDIKKTIANFENYNIINISIKEKKGLEDLKKSLFEMVGKSVVSEDFLFISLQDMEIIRKVKEKIKDLLSSLQGLSSEIIMLEVRDILNYLEEIIGNVYTEEVLDKIFSSFCIGK